jgi:hypothetical protein
LAVEAVELTRVVALLFLELTEVRAEAVLITQTLMGLALELVDKETLAVQVQETTLITVKQTEQAVAAEVLVP